MITFVAVLLFIAVLSLEVVCSRWWIKERSLHRRYAAHLDEQFAALNAARCELNDLISERNRVTVGTVFPEKPFIGQRFLLQAAEPIEGVLYIFTGDRWQHVLGPELAASNNTPVNIDPVKSESPLGHHSALWWCKLN